jgi:hypothetical protein
LPTFFASSPSTCFDARPLYLNHLAFGAGIEEYRNLRKTLHMITNVDKLLEFVEAAEISCITTHLCNIHPKQCFKSSSPGSVVIVGKFLRFWMKHDWFLNARINTAAYACLPHCCVYQHYFPKAIIVSRRSWLHTLPKKIWSSHDASCHFRARLSEAAIPLPKWQRINAR